MKKKTKFSKLIIILSILHIDVFILGLFLLHLNNLYLSDTAITCFFSFWGLEMLSLAGIKIKKLKYDNSYESNLEEVNSEE